MDLKTKLEECPKHYENFKKTFVNVIGTHAILHRNHKLQVSKSLGQAIMKPCEHKNKANKTKLQDDITE